MTDGFLSAALVNMAQAIGPSLLVAALAIPLVFLTACLSQKLRPYALNLQWIAPLPAAAAALLVLTDAPLTFEAPSLNISLWLDLPGAILLIVVASLWIVTSPTAFLDIRDKSKAQRFAVCWLLTLTGSLGVFIAADLLTFFLVYALVSIPAYGLIAHNEDIGSRRAGGVYMAFTLLGETLLLMGFVLLAASEPHGSLRIVDVMTALPTSPWRNVTFALLIAGFGMKIGLVPFHGWMPLAYTAAPIPAAAVLSGGAVKAGVIGLIRFLPFELVDPGWGTALAVLGFLSAFYGVAIGITQRNPKAVLAYSSISQMGVIAAVLGVGLVGADQNTPSDVSFYAANHVLVKASLFLTLTIAAAANGPFLWLVFFVAAVLALSLGGLPLTGGALAKLATKATLGSGVASTLATVSAAGSTLLMLHFLFCLARTQRQAKQVAAPPTPLWPWLAMALASSLLPWIMFPVLGGHSAEALTSSAFLEAFWPVLAGTALIPVLWLLGRFPPRIPAGDMIVAKETAFHASFALGSTLERMESQLRQWPAAGLSLLAVALILAVALSASH